MILKHNDIPLKSLRTNQRFKSNKKSKNKRHNKRFFDTQLVTRLNISLANNALYSLAISLIAGCYSLNASKELIRTFIVGIEGIRSEYDI